MEEMLDTYDINGNFLGVKSRSFCHSGNVEIYHKSVWVWIINNKGEILVQKRALTKKNSPGKWDMSSAGHVDAGEDCLTACVRETEEELGIKVKPDEFVFLKQYIQKKSWELAQIYLLRNNTEEKNFTLQTEEVEQIKWLSFNEFTKLLYSEEFCNHPKEYKDWVCEMLKTNI